MPWAWEILDMPPWQLKFTINASVSASLTVSSSLLPLMRSKYFPICGPRGALQASKLHNSRHRKIRLEVNLCLACIGSHCCQPLLFPALKNQGEEHIKDWKPKGSPWRHGLNCLPGTFLNSAKLTNKNPSLSCTEKNNYLDFQNTYLACRLQGK